MQSALLSFARFLNIRAAGNVSFHPAGDRVAFITDMTGVPQAWAISTEGGWPEQLTFESERVNFAKYGPEGRMVFGMDTGGNELQQLYLLSPDGSQVRNLTNRPDAMHYWGSWSRDGRTLAFASNRRDPRYFDAYLCDLETGEVRLVYQADATIYAGPLSPDGRWLILIRVNRSLDDDLLLLDLASGEAIHLTPHDGKASYEGAQWSADGQSLYLATDQDRDTAALVRLDVATRTWHVLDAPDWDVENVTLSPDGQRLAYTVNVDGWSELRALDVATGQRVDVPGGLPQGVISVLPVCRDPRAGSALTWSPDSRSLAVCLSSGTRPPDVWRVEVGRGEEDGRIRSAGEGGGGRAQGGSVRQLTHSSLAGVPASELVEPQVIRYPTFDGRPIPALYYVPPREAAGRRPVVVYVHGGPEGQSQPNFNNVIAYFVHRGYAVLAPNVRGSTGYGRVFTHLDDVEKRMDSVADLKAAVEWLTTQGGADPQRIAVMGGSYGGFMTLAAVTEYPELWAAAVDIVGIGNFVTFLERTGAYRRSHRESEYGSLERDRDLLERISPIHKVDRITAPMMVIHGANDPRVPIFEAEQMVASLQARNHPVEYLRFEDEGHGIVKLANKLVAYPAIGDFLDRYLWKE